MRSPINTIEEIYDSLVISDEITRPVTDPFQFLMEDHRRIADLLEEASETSENDVSRREELFARIRDGLVDHTEMEEAFLYPVLEEIESLRAMTNESYEEHDQAETLLAEMDEMSKGTEEWTAKLTVLREDIEHHVNEEERDLFPRAKDNLSREAQDLMASQFEEYLEDSITY